jgi:hypothetical protein
MAALCRLLSRFRLVAAKMNLNYSEVLSLDYFSTTTTTVEVQLCHPEIYILRVLRPRVKPQFIKFPVKE